jgi:hypothetical protein
MNCGSAVGPGKIDREMDRYEVKMADTRRIVEEVLLAQGYSEAVSAGWEITDHDEESGLAVAHFRYGADATELGRIRGLVVDTKLKKFVTDSHGYIPTIEIDQIPEDGSSSTNVDLDGKAVFFDPKAYTYKYGYEGTMIRAMRYGGKTYFMTHRKLSSDVGRWGKSRTFKTLYDELGGPKESELFDLTRPDSSHVYYFIVVHPELSVVSQQDLKGGQIVYIGSRPCAANEDTEAEIKVKISEQIEIPMCNVHLKTGYYAPESIPKRLPAQQWPGEFVIAYPKTGGQLLRIESPSYRWRASLRGENPILNHQLFLLKDNASLRRDMDNTHTYLQYFPVINNTISEIKEHVLAGTPTHLWLSVSTKKIEHDADLRYENIWKCFVAAMPLHNRRDLLEFLPSFRGIVHNISMWLYGLEESGNIKNYKDDDAQTRRMVDIIQTAVSWAGKSKEVGKTRKQIIQDNLMSLVKRESGRTLYMIWKALQHEAT